LSYRNVTAPLAVQREDDAVDPPEGIADKAAKGVVTSGK
jgi:hypothetical protein